MVADARLERKRLAPVDASTSPGAAWPEMRAGGPMTLTRDRVAELLSAARLFDGVDAEGMDRIAAVAVQVDFAGDHVIARQGEIGTGFFIIVTGAARVVRDGATIATIGPGDFFGELSVLDGRPRTAQVIAAGPTTCLALASWDFEAVLLGQPGVTLAILRGLASRLRDLTEAHRH
jgi:CRP/FNR family cyclic AMP-dependent transcriptional regulator